MRKALYELIRDRLLTIEQDGKPVIRHIDLFNEQLLNIEQEVPFYTPAVLIEFNDIDWQPLLHGLREATIDVSLHILTDSRDAHYADTLKRLALLDDIHRVLHASSASLQGVGIEAIEQNFGVSKNTTYKQYDRPCSQIDALTLTRSTTDHNFDELTDDIEQYSCHVTDASTYNRF